MRKTRLLYLLIFIVLMFLIFFYFMNFSEKNYSIFNSTKYNNNILDFTENDEDISDFVEDNEDVPDIIEDEEVSDFDEDKENISDIIEDEEDVSDFTEDTLDFIEDNNYIIDSWVGTYSFHEYLPPNQVMNYSINIYDDLYAYIIVDGFQTIDRLKVKALNNEEEITFIFYEFYTDEEGNCNIYESYFEGDVLLKLKKQEDVLITEWEKIQPMIIKNEEPGQYFVKKDD